MRALAAALLLAALPIAALAQPKSPEWIQRSNADAQILMGVFAKLAPEQAGRMGVPGLDTEIFDLTPGYEERAEAAGRQAVAALQKNLEAEKDPLVREDLEILIDRANQGHEGHELNHRLMLPYFDVSSTVFQGIRPLLDDQVSAERRGAALVRLRKYAGMEKGYTPLAELAEARTRERLPETALIGPVKAEVERDLSQGATYVAGIGKLFEKYKIKGYQKPLEQLQKQLAAYEGFVRAEILPRARTDFRQPPELYAFGLKEFGNDMAVPELTSRAAVAFKEIQNQMQAMAPRVAEAKGCKLTGYRDVLRELKKQQLAGDAILPYYEKRIQDVEEIIRREGIVTLPQRKMLIRLASEAEAAAVPAPNMQPPRLIGNTGEMGTFVLPLQIPGKTPQQKLAFDDFTFEAASWTLTAHEGRPGHELQFASVVEKGVSLARALFALNSVNVEGWGLYAESELQPYEPLEGQFITLQHRMMRAARAFLDPGLQSGAVTQEEAMRVLQEDVGLSEAMATQEVQRYTFLAPGQAPSYFVGYSRLLEIRQKAELALGKRFNRTRFNDFVLAQGMLPPRLLDKAVTEEFVPSEKAQAAGD
ncbi:MAG TPA: DUF885 domain-containing protein [Candidatus Eisenbacteria bacterium]|jgi:uncharacterized protein (DUF885 family)